MKIQNLVNSFKSSPLDEMKSFVLSFSRQYNLDTGDLLPARPLALKAISLNPKQQEALEPAITALVNDDIFEEKNGQYYLTANGRNVLY